MIKTINMVTQKADWICNDCLPETDKQYIKLEEYLKGVHNDKISRNRI